MDTRNQVIMTSPSRKLVGSYVTKKGQKLLANPNLKAKERKEITAKYTKNRYEQNPYSKPFLELKKDAEKGTVVRERHIKHKILPNSTIKL